MPDSRNYITHYVKYFNLQAPSVLYQTLILLLLGACAGGFASIIIHMHGLGTGLPQILLSGISSGILVVSLPALLTVATIKSIRRKMLLKHAMLSTLFITAIYAILLFIGSAIFVVTENAAVSYLSLLLANAGIYGYWLLMGKFLIGRLRKIALVAAVQPVLNILFYIPLGRYILSFGVPLNIALIKLFAGMAVFLSLGYAFIYILDRPSKKILEASGMNVIVSMVNQWLFDLSSDVNVLGQGAGVNRDLELDVIAIKDSGKYRAVFVNPDIHFGPFRGVGGSVVPLNMGKMIADRFGAVPFVLHSPLDIQDNPISTSKAYALGGQVEQGIKRMGRFAKAYGGVGRGNEGSCRSTRIGIGDVDMFLLSKAPHVTEDMTREVGMHLKHYAETETKNGAVLVDAHNSRFESASADELAGIQQGSRYIGMYEKAIRGSAANRGRRRMEFGASQRRIARLLGSPRDLGEGYTSVGVFKFGRKRFCIVYIDANNMLPTFRDRLIAHIKKRFGMEAEVCTTDTHSINMISSSASMSLGRITNVNSVMPIIETMVKNAMENMRPARYAYKKMKIKDFDVWGDKADMLIERASAEARKILKYVAPLFVAVAFTIAAWVIYVV